mmetsp:Transcript_31607/g.73720  ORF Transcript_31607/g.73720 Transcript_31607/m.73720 type:complete len:312 (-) Transcript_31607:141-1076(-)
MAVLGRMLAVVAALSGAVVPAEGFLVQSKHHHETGSASSLRGAPLPKQLSLAPEVDLPPHADTHASSWWGIAGRTFAASMAALLVLAAPGSLRAVHAEESAAAPAPKQVQIYFGQGCFWHVQHELVKKEVRSLGRGASEITSLVGYAGGTKDSDRVCYHNLALAPDYSTLGHTEVVAVNVPEESVGDFAKAVLDDAARFPFGRADPQDRGGEYRSAIGLPGGMESPLFKQIEEANQGRLELIAGKGDDPDTVATKKIWVYDSNKFPFYQGEVYHQFHDDMIERYTETYKKIKNTMLENGKLRKVQCPEVGF